jgi:hypothetical protein
MRKIEIKQEEMEEDVRLMNLYTELEEAKMAKREAEFAERARQQKIRARGFEKNEGAESAARDKAETDRLMEQQAEKDRLSYEREMRDKRNAFERQRDMSKVLAEQMQFKKDEAARIRREENDVTDQYQKEAAAHVADYNATKARDRGKKLQCRKDLEAQVRCSTVQKLAHVCGRASVVTVVRIASANYNINTDSPPPTPPPYSLTFAPLSRSAHETRRFSTRWTSVRYRSTRAS